MMQRRNAMKAILTLAMAPSLAISSAEARAAMLRLVAGEPEWLSYATSLADEFNHRKSLRVLPHVGQGSLQTLSDITQPQGPDAALVSADCLAYADAQGLLAPARQNFSLVARVASLPIVLVTNTSIPSLTILANKRICTGPAPSAGFATGELVFGALGVPFVRVPKSHVEALSVLRRGDADGALLLGTDALTRAGGLNGFHILPLPVPQGLEDVYSAHTLNAVDLPGLPANAAKLDTISTSLVLATSTQRRGLAQEEALKSLITELFSGPSQLQWMARANLAADVPGWQRNPLAGRAASSTTSTQ
jgi:TRAP-type uncharacterized transport system substrate-binding protein